MADKTKIEWTEATWNPITGCTVHSAGCTNCYAMKLAGTRMKDHWSRKGLTKDTKAGPVWNGAVRFNEPWLDQPLRWAKPRMIFVCAHADLFHEAVPDEWIDKIFAVMALCPQHTFQVLTKRSARMREYCNTLGRHASVDRVSLAAQKIKADKEFWYTLGKGGWHLPNVWIGVSVENQISADERIPDLLETPAAVHWLSCEPLLGPVNLTKVEPKIYAATANALTGIWNWKDGPVKIEWQNVIDWVVAGGESGPGARPMYPDWVISLRDQCEAARTPFFFKQWGEYLPVHVDTITHVGHEFQKVGKKAAGRKLHGMTYDGMPA